ncbi:MAG: metalloregulator ArsR/SmtB family transcription factor [Verrucomicrobia bacterium]|nr:metalloregulator ArsR/SmtB family transcription factor [Verrucomicrobiota bacterium]
MQMTSVAAALADGGRLKAVVYLADGELCACQLAAALGLAQSTVSRHMAVLERAGLVVSRKDGRWVHFRRAGRPSPGVVRAALRWVDRHAGDADVTPDERARVAAIRRAAPTAFCGGRGGSR